MAIITVLSTNSNVLLCVATPVDGASLLSCFIIQLLLLLLYDFYWDAKEWLPSDMPPVQGRSVSTNCFVDSAHAGDKVTHRSRTGILIFLN